MSTTPFKWNSHIYYDVAWSVLTNGERKWHKRPSFSHTPDEALNETKECILLSSRPDFEMRVAGIRFE